MVNAKHVLSNLLLVFVCLKYVLCACWLGNKLIS
jgi:hypothetical protein